MARQFPAHLLRAGYRLQGSLCDKNGAVAIQAGVVLTDAILKAHARVIGEGLLLGADWTERTLAEVFPKRRVRSAEAPSSERSRAISIDMLRPGMRLSCSLYDAAGILLLLAGREVSAGLIEHLRSRGDTIVQLVPSIGAATSEPDSQNAESALACELIRHADLIGGISSAKPVRLPLDEMQVHVKSGLATHARASAALACSYKAITVHSQSCCEETVSFAEEFIADLNLDSDLLPTIVSMQESQDEYLYDHAVNVAMMSVTIGSRLGLERDQLRELGLGAFFHDVGMLRIPDELRLAERKLTDAEWREIRQHPIHAFEYLQGIKSIPTGAALIGYQAHERCDGSGYPHGRDGRTIHPYAKIVAVADVFTALTRARPHRPALLPHEAVRMVLTQGSQGRFDRVVLRAFLESVSAFPIGSYVELKKGIHARVVRANPVEHTRPVVVALEADGALSDWVIDLAKEKNLKIVRAIGQPDLSPVAA